MSKTKTRFLYLGREWRDHKEKVVHRYAEIDESNIVLSTDYVYYKKLFKKGSVGALYDVELKNDKQTVSYSKDETPLYMTEHKGKYTGTSIVFRELLQAHEVKDRLAGTQERIRKKETVKDVYGVDSLRDMYRDLTPSQRPFFIAEVVRQITK